MTIPVGPVIFEIDMDVCIVHESFDAGELGQVLSALSPRN